MIQTKNRGKYRILPGNPEKMGASATKDGYNFAVEVSDGKKAELLLYRKGHQKPFLTVPLPEEERTGVISSVEITGLTVGKFSYAYRMDEAFRHHLNYADDEYLLQIAEDGIIRNYSQAEEVVKQLEDQFNTLHGCQLCRGSDLGEKDD